MVAEDDSALRHLVAESLRRAGYAVTEVGDGAEALDTIGAQLVSGARDLPDVVVADVRMPYLSGLAVLAALRDVDPGIPIILMTAFGDASTHALAHRLGAIDVLDKPFDLDVLHASVARAVSEVRSHVA